MTLIELEEKLRAWGPDRVVINTDGEAVSSRRARERGIVPEVIFARNGDGWMLGAPAHLVDVAERMYPDEWVAVFERASGWEPVSYQRWKRHR